MAALQAIGAQQSLAIVTRQRAIVERLNDHPELKSYQDIYRLLTAEELEEIGDELDPQLWDAMEEIPLLGAKHFDATA